METNVKKKRTDHLSVIAVIFLSLVMIGLVFAGFRLTDDSLPSNTVLEGSYPPGMSNLMKSNLQAISIAKGYGEEEHDNSQIDLANELSKDRRIPLFLQWDNRWGYQKYGGDYMAVTGCGPTCLSMIKTGLSGSKKWNPYKVAKKAEKNGFYVEGQGTSWSLMSTGAAMYGLCSREVIFDETHIIQELQEGRPIICSMRPGEFTTTGHFIVLEDVDENGMILLNDPNSYDRSNQPWELSRLMPQIRNLWSYELEDSNPQ